MSVNHLVYQQLSRRIAVRATRWPADALAEVESYQPRYTHQFPDREPHTVANEKAPTAALARLSPQINSCPSGICRTGNRAARPHTPHSGRTRPIRHRPLPWDTSCPDPQRFPWRNNENPPKALCQSAVRLPRRTPSRDSRRCRIEPGPRTSKVPHRDRTHHPVSRGLCAYIGSNAGRSGKGASRNDRRLMSSTIAVLVAVAGLLAWRWQLRRNPNWATNDDARFYVSSGTWSAIIALYWFLQSQLTVHWVWQIWPVLAIASLILLRRGSDSLAVRQDQFTPLPPAPRRDGRGSDRLLTHRAHHR
jgi:hypothetical protein